MMERQKEPYEMQQSSKHEGTSEHSSQMNIETDVNLTKKKRIIFWVYLATILAFLVVITILSVKSYQPTKEFLATDSYYYARQVANDWQTGFITDIQVVNGSINSCPAGFEDAVNFQWTGTTFGCLCQLSANLSFALSGYCSPGLIQQSCSNMAQRPSLFANNWLKKGRICIKRSSVSFASQAKYDGTNKICGSSQSLVIMPASVNCPMVNISFSAFSLEDHYLTALNSGSLMKTLYAAFNSTSPYSFYTYPVSKFVVSEYEFCQIDTDSGLDPGHSDFVLLKYARGCAKAGNYSLLDTMSQISFYSNNANLQALTAIKGFPQPGNWDYHLGFASVAGWTYKCRHTYNGKFSIPKAIQQFTFSYYNTYYNILIGVAVALIVILLEIFVLTLRRVINNAVYPVGYRQRNLPKHFFLALSRYLIDISAKLVILGLTLINLFTIYSNYNWFKSAVNLNCPDGNLSTFEDIMDPYMSLYTKLFNYSLSTLVISVFMLVIDIVHFAYIYRGELTFYLIETEDKMMVKKQDDEELKWVDQKEIFDQKEELPLPQKDDADQFRITMAQNIFSREDSEPLPQKLKKKKKKKISPLRRKQEEEENIKQDGIQGDSSDFNPFLLEDDSIAQLQSPEIAPKPFKPKLKKRKL